MSLEPVLLPAPLRRALAAAAEAAYPHEFCALLLGRQMADGQGLGVVIEDWRPAANIHPEPARHFELDPAAHFAVLREMRGRTDGQRLIGHVHSHPDAGGPPVPSATDLAMAFDPEMLWLILSVDAGQAAGLSAWRLGDGTFVPLEIKSVEE